MSKTLARQIRRIGLLRTTFNETQEQRLVTEIVDGKKVGVEKTITKRTPVRHRDTLGLDELAYRRTEIVEQYKIRNRMFRAKRKAGTTGGEKTQPVPLKKAA